MELNERAQSYLERMDYVVRAAEIKWGIMFGLEALVPAELAAKFKTQWNHLSEAVMTNDYEGIITHADGVVRGVWALERMAIQSGQEPLVLPPIGLGVKPMPPEKEPEYKPSGLPMDQELGF